MKNKKNYFVTYYWYSLMSTWVFLVWKSKYDQYKIYRLCDKDNIEIYMTLLYDSS